MQVTIEPGSLRGNIQAPSSKSYTQRAYAAALLHKGKTTIKNPGNSMDELAALNIIRQAGCLIYQTPDKVEIISTGKPDGNELYDCGESGLATRMFLPILAGSAPSLTLTGSGGLLKRNLGDLQTVMNQLGIEIPCYTGTLPLTLNGSFIPCDIDINATDSSQVLTGLLFAVSSTTKKPITIRVQNLASKPYIDMTLAILEQSGKPVLNNNYKEFLIEPTRFHIPNELNFNVEGDWSSAAFFLVGGAISGKVTVNNLQMNSSQADKVIVKILLDAGAGVQIDNDYLTVQKADLQAFEFDATHCPDMFPILAILASCCNGESAITGLHRLFHKESNRIESIGEMLIRFDIPFTMQEDTLYITGRPGLNGYPHIDTYLDHRIEMAAAIGALRAKGKTQISRAGTHTKSYLNFWNDLKNCGAAISFD